jgi:hypothetical protein
LKRACHVRELVCTCRNGTRHVARVPGPRRAGWRMTRCSSFWIRTRARVEPNRARRRGARQDDGPRWRGGERERFPLASMRCGRRRAPGAPRRWIVWTRTERADPEACSAGTAPAAAARDSPRAAWSETGERACAASLRSFADQSASRLASVVRARATTSADADTGGPLCRENGNARQHGTPHRADTRRGTVPSTTQAHCLEIRGAPDGHEARTSRDTERRRVHPHRAPSIASARWRSVSRNDLCEKFRDATSPQASTVPVFAIPERHELAAPSALRASGPKYLERWSGRRRPDWRGTQACGTTPATSRSESAKVVREQPPRLPALHRFRQFSARGRLEGPGRQPVCCAPPSIRRRSDTQARIETSVKIRDGAARPRRAGIARRGSGPPPTPSYVERRAANRAWLLTVHGQMRTFAAARRRREGVHKHQVIVTRRDGVRASTTRLLARFSVIALKLEVKDEEVLSDDASAVHRRRTRLFEPPFRFGWASQIDLDRDDARRGTGDGLAAPRSRSARRADGGQGDTEAGWNEPAGQRTTRGALESEGTGTDVFTGGNRELDPRAGPRSPTRPPPRLPR